MIIKQNGLVMGDECCYEIDDGKIVKIFQMGHGSLSYYDEQGHNSTMGIEDFKKIATLREDLDDFPNVKDIRLPYVFDLVYDIKRRSQLTDLILQIDLEYVQHLKEMIQETNIVLTESETGKLQDRIEDWENHICTPDQNTHKI